MIRKEKVDDIDGLLAQYYIYYKAGSNMLKTGMKIY